MKTTIKHQVSPKRIEVDKKSIEENEINEFILEHVGKHTIKQPTVEPHEIVVGRRFVAFDPQTCSTEVIEVTYVRTGIFFYNSSLHKEEQTAPCECLFASRMMKFMHISTNMNPKYMELHVEFDEQIIEYDSIIDNKR